MKIGIGQASRVMSGESNGPPLVAISETTGGRASPPAGGIAVLADDVGGLESERKAARLVIHDLVKRYCSQPSPSGIPAALMQALESANHLVCKIAHKDPNQAAVGVSLVAAALHVDGLYWIAVGDSRLYCLRNGELVELTRDQTFARHLRQRVMRGEMLLGEVQNIPERVGLSSYLGMDPIPQIDATVRPFPLQAGDKLLLCSNGLYSTLSPEHIANALRFNAQPAANELVALASKGISGAHDGIQAAVLALPPPKSSRSHVAGTPGQASAPIPAGAPLPPSRRRNPKVMVLALGLTLVCALIIAMLLLLFESQTEPTAVTATEALPEQALRNGSGAPPPVYSSQPGDAPMLPPRPLQYRDMERY